MPLRSQRRTLEYVLRSALIPNQHHIYTIGPFGYRAGFAFQQERALHLVAALKTTISESDLTKKRIAIIGGGVAGVTAFAALAKWGCSSIRIYEKEAELLQLQKYSKHRLVHPNYNKWPVVEDLNSFTDLPGNMPLT